MWVNFLHTLSKFNKNLLDILNENDVLRFGSQYVYIYLPEDIRYAVLFREIMSVN
jgi:hypothetical protein